MVESPRGVQQTGRDIVGFEVRKVLEDLLLRLARSQQFQDVDHANMHPTNAGAAPTLFGTDSDALETLSGGHRRCLVVRDFHRVSEYCSERLVVMNSCQFNAEIRSS